MEMFSHFEGSISRFPVSQSPNHCDAMVVRAQVYWLYCHCWAVLLLLQWTLVGWCLKPITKLIGSCPEKPPTHSTAICWRWIAKHYRTTRNGNTHLCSKTGSWRQSKNKTQCSSVLQKGMFKAKWSAPQNNQKLIMATLAQSLTTLQFAKHGWKKQWNYAQTQHQGTMVQPFHCDLQTSAKHPKTTCTAGALPRNFGVQIPTAPQWEHFNTRHFLGHGHCATDSHGWERSVSPLTDRNGATTTARKQQEYWEGIMRLMWPNQPAASKNLKSYQVSNT